EADLYSICLVGFRVTTPQRAFARMTSDLNFLATSTLFVNRSCNM
ncbi:MAG: hypothetical protein ACI93E_000849, partial [Flavobacteriales bacterium]